MEPRIAKHILPMSTGERGALETSSEPEICKLKWRGLIDGAGWGCGFGREGSLLEPRMANRNWATTTGERGGFVCISGWEVTFLEPQFFKLM